MSFVKKIKKLAKQITGWSKLKNSIQPKHNFGEKAAPKPPDYGNLDHWFAHPKIDSKVKLTPIGVLETDAWKSGEVDVFFIAPTLTFTKLGWNAPINHPSSTELISEMIMGGQASVFNSCCRIFSPKYRQATFYSFLGAGNNGRKALELAYEDCLAAFDYYLAHFNDGRPFFLAGHSQGALHTMRLLDDRIEGTPLAKKMVAAYPIGFWFPQDKFGTTLKTIRPAESATEVNCVVAYDTYMNTGGPIRKLDRAEIVYGGKNGPKWEKRNKKTPLGVNPLSWKRDHQVVSESQHLGGVHILLEGKKRPDWAGFVSEEPLGLNVVGLSKPYVEECSAQIRPDGFLYVSSPRSWAFKRMIMPGGNLHLSDFSLFYMNLRKNIEDRWKAFSTMSDE
ncbi:MAG: DUF3089 domain-containing protein [Bacteroidota bacterium]